MSDTKLSLSPLKVCQNFGFCSRPAKRGEIEMLNSNDLRNLKIAATTSKHNYDTVSLGRGKGEGRSSGM